MFLRGFGVYTLMLKTSAEHATRDYLIPSLNVFKSPTGLVQLQQRSRGEKTTRLLAGEQSRKAAKRAIPFFYVLHSCVDRGSFRFVFDVCSVNKSKEYKTKILCGVAACRQLIKNCLLNSCV